MKAKTKKKRIEYVLQVLKKRVGVKLPIGFWLADINEGLPKQNMFRSTKELAKAFKYISCSMDGKLVRSKENLFPFLGLKTKNTVYLLEGDKNSE
jgi:L-rhamnose isomerase